MKIEEKYLNNLSENEIIKTLFKDIHRSMTGKVTEKEHIKQIAQRVLKDTQTLLSILVKPDFDANSEKSKKSMLDSLKDVNKSLQLIKKI